MLKLKCTWNFLYFSVITVFPLHQYEQIWIQAVYSQCKRLRVSRCIAADLYFRPFLLFQTKSLGLFLETLIQRSGAASTTGTPQHPLWRCSCTSLLFSETTNSATTKSTAVSSRSQLSATICLWCLLASSRNPIPLHLLQSHTQGGVKHYNPYTFLTVKEARLTFPCFWDLPVNSKRGVILQYLPGDHVIRLQFSTKIV